MYISAFNRAGMGRASQLVNATTLGYPPSLSLVAPQFMVETNSTWARILLLDVWYELTVVVTCNSISGPTYLNDITNDGMM